MATIDTCLPTISIALGNRGAETMKQEGNDTSGDTSTEM